MTEATAEPLSSNTVTKAEKPQTKRKMDLKGLLAKLKLGRKEGIDEKPTIRHMPDGWSFVANGIIIQTNPVRNRRQYRLGNEEVVIPENTPWARIDFKPGGREEYATGTMTDAVAQGLQGLSTFFSYLDKPKKGFWLEPRPQYFWGMTNEQMARFAIRKLGFFAVEQQTKRDEHSTQEQNENGKKVLVIAKAETVQQKLAATQAREVSGVPLTERLAQRAQSE